jgi:O-antigen ligase
MQTAFLWPSIDERAFVKFTAMDFAFFTLLNVVLFIRPSEIIPDLASIPIYEMVIIVCLALAFPRIVGQLSIRSLERNPISTFVVGFWLAVVLSQLFGMFYLTGAKDAGLKFGKVVLYYLLLVAVVDNVHRLQRLLLAICILTACVCGIAILQYHGIINVHGMTTLQTKFTDAATGAIHVAPRIQATGIFSDPNDLSMLAVLGAFLAAYSLSVPRWRPFMLLWILAIPFFLYALVLTQSRGGFIAFLVGSVVLFQSRFGWPRAVALLACALPLVLLLFGGRQTEFADAVSSGTGQQRIQLWAEGFRMLKSSLIFGIGQGQFAEEARWVAHNSFVHAYAELGLFGGTMFLAAFAYPIWTLHRLGTRDRIHIVGPSLLLMRPYLLAAIAGYAGAMLTLSRNYIVPTYLVLGVATVYLRLVQSNGPIAGLTLDRRLARRMAFVSVFFLATTYMFIRVFARWSGG